MTRQIEITEAINYIQTHLYDEITLDKLASHVAYSPFHFSRIFKQETGLPPLYFVSSMRLQRAKELLLNTNMCVRDIALEIGQQSLGTFTTRFTNSVGVTPANFRNTQEEAETLLNSLQQLGGTTGFQHSAKNPLSVKGTVFTDEEFEGVILVGLFPKPIPEGMPLYGTLLFSLGEFQFKNVKPGLYYLFATSVSWGMNARSVLIPHTTLRYKPTGSIQVNGNEQVPHQDLHLRAAQLDDPPILISIPRLMNNFLQRTKTAIHEK
ncbi:AraC family transcriptional regulator [Neobacillus piezotolerans]|uniref:AraC family transcriptional regulator n=1 Tax=Neobacillus piezotolerans TaxID=2259171 RepID=A0A3D8GSB3_9BACI|nr:AraC family transcriptional regulator [Neobacillus piezotolerans]RDU37141.1 AraC family transcriptional regulator [Neobacillus piezotolerans]